MTLHGVDVYLFIATSADLPKQVGKLTLEFVSNKGNKVYPGPLTDIRHYDWPQCRYSSDEVVTDAEVDAAIQSLSQGGFSWSMCQKLYRDGTTNLYSQPY
ncbi:MAG: hypothetical protein K8R88_13115 [Armatimonadetes bacterium]|nr:hypothetical protein [Armatimonadota bacterium]